MDVLLGSVISERAVSGENRAWFRLCTSEKDSFGTNVFPDGANLERHKKNPVFLWMHSMSPKPIAPQVPSPDVVIGRVVTYEQTRTALDIEVEFDVENQFARECYRKVVGGWIRGVSIGFNPTHVEMITVEDEITSKFLNVPVGQQAKCVTKWDLLEASLVIVPANEDALKLARSFGVDTHENMTTDEIIDLVAARVEERAHIKKGDGHAIAHEKYDLDDGPWDAEAEKTAWRKVCSSDGSGDWSKVDHAKYAKMFAYVAGDGSSPSDYKLPHHVVKSGRLFTNKKGVSAALGAINGARGGVHIPASVAAAVKAHLEAHAKEFEEHEKKSASGSEKTRDESEESLPGEISKIGTGEGGGGSPPTPPSTSAKPEEEDGIDFPAPKGNSAENERATMPGKRQDGVREGLKDLKPDVKPPTHANGQASAPTFASTAGSGGNVSPPTKGDPKMKITREHAYIARSLIGSHMRAAEGHMQCMSLVPSGGKAAHEHAMHGFHKGAAMQQIEHAHALAGHLRDAMDGDDDEDSMRSACLPEARACAENIGDADLRAKYNEVAKAVQKFDMVTTGEMLERSLGETNVDKLAARLDVLVASQEKLLALKAEQRSAKNDLLAQEREKLIGELLDKQLMTPAQAERARKEAWTLVRMGEFKAQAEQVGPVVPIVRTAPLNPAERSAPTPTNPEGALVPGTPPPSPGTKPEDRSHGAKVTAGAGANLGLDQEKLQLRFEKNRAHLMGDFEKVRQIEAQLRAMDAPKQ